MTTPINTIPNDRNLVRVYAGTEAVTGTKVPATYKLYGEMKINKTQALNQNRKDYAGTRLANYTPVYSPPTIDGTYSQDLTFNDFVILPRYGVAKAPTPTSDGHTVPGYTYEYVPPGLAPSFDTASIEWNVPGVPFQATGVFWNQFTISGDTDNADDAWQFSANLLGRSKDLIAGTGVLTATGGSTTTVVLSSATWTVNAFAGAYVYIRSGAAAGSAVEVASNTATTLTLASTLPAAVASGDKFEVSGSFTSGIVDRSHTDVIPMSGTKLYIDESGGTIGTTQVLGRFISFSLTYEQGMYFKRFAEDVEAFSSKTNVGMVKVTGQCRLEFDDYDEYNKWLGKSSRIIRITQTGAIIDPGTSTPASATIDLYNVYYDTADDSQDRQDNLTLTMGWVAFVDPTEAVPCKFRGVVPLATLP